MSDLQSVRTELAALAPEGWYGYDTIGQAVELPALVVGMPDRITYEGSFRLLRVTLPLMWAVPSNDESQERLLSAIMEHAPLFRSGGTTYRSSTINEISNFRIVQLGSAQALAGDVVLELLINV